MFGRQCLWTVLLVSPALALVGCSNPSGLASVQVSPTTVDLTVGQTAQLTATGTFGNARHPSTEDVTGTIAWASSVPSVATVNAAGLVTAVGAGTTTITGSATAFNGPVSSSATITVTGSGGAPSSGGTLLSLQIIPSTISVGNLQDTGQFLAIGTYSVAPFVRDVTNLATTTWISSVPSVFAVNSNTQGTLGATAGIVTAYGSGNAVVTVEARNPADGTIQTATASFACPLVLPNPPTTPGSCYPGSQVPSLLATLTVYNEGLNTSNWLVTAPSATGTPNVLNCGPGSAPNSSICVATYPVGTTVTVTAPKQSGVNFGGWSYNCTPTAPITAAGPNSCTITLTTNDTVGAIFN
jgi:hypothetical protein